MSHELAPWGSRALKGRSYTSGSFSPLVLHWGGGGGQEETGIGCVVSGALSRSLFCASFISNKVGPSTPNVQLSGRLSSGVDSVPILSSPERGSGSGGWPQYLLRH